MEQSPKRRPVVPTDGSFGELSMVSGSHKPMYRVRCFIHPSQHFHDLSYLYTGLCALAKQGRLRIDFASPGENATHASDPVTLWTEVSEVATGREVRIAFDQYDRSDVFAREALKDCDVYFKRSFFRPNIESSLDPDLRRKVVPFGLTYPCRTMESTFPVLYPLLPRSIRRILTFPGDLLRKAYDLRLFMTSPSISTFEQPPDHRAEKSILFQSRIWAKSELVGESEEEVNFGRIELVGMLVKEFGSAFKGGIIVSRTSVRNCPPDLITYQPTLRGIYIARSKRAMVGIYTRGLYHSLGFKLAEYLASSKCIVASPFRNELPTRLMPRVNYLEYSSPRQCVECCKELLSDEKLSIQMRRNNWEYYQREVRPDRRIASCLQRAFA